MSDLQSDQHSHRDPHPDERWRRERSSTSPVEGPSPASAPPRPVPPPSLAARLGPWIEWFGPARLISGSIAVIVVCAGGYWLLRPPAPPAEAMLPRADSSAPAVTLAPPAPDAGSAGELPATAASPAAEVPPGSSTPNGAAMVSVHVAGAVVRPGVYVLPGAARVDDALLAAGGAVAGADPHALNLAAPLADGSRVYVPLVGEEVDGPLTQTAPGSVLDPPGGGPIAADGTAGPIDVNTATARELESLPGVGPATAAAIITERERNGPFVGVDDLDRVPGIGPARLEALRDLVTT